MTLALVGPARAATYSLETAGGDGEIEGLSFEGSSLQTQESGGRAIVVIRGKFERGPEGWSLYARSSRLTLGTDGSFRIRLPATRAEISLVFRAEGPAAEEEKQAMVLRRSDDAEADPDDAEAEPARTSKAAPPRAEAGKAYTFIPGIGYSSISYNETGFGDFKESAVTFRLGFNLVIDRPRWTLDSNLSYAALPFGAQPAANPARILNVEGRVGYTLGSGKFTARVSGGLYFSQMTVAESAFGYTGLLSPQGALSVRMQAAKSLALTAFGRFAPIGGFADRDITFGGGVVATGMGKPILVGIEYNDRQFSFQDLANARGALKMLTLSVSVAL